MNVTLELAGHEVHARRWNAKQGSTPILLVPGLGGSCVDWEPAGARLAEATGSTVTAIDLPGFGRSRLPRGRADLRRFGDVVAAALEEAGPTTLVGNSMGGLVAMLVARDHPDRVAHLVLADPALPAGRVSFRSLVGALPFLITTTPLVGPRVVKIRKRLLGPERYVAVRLRNNVHRLDRVDPDLRASLVELSRERLAYPEAARAYAHAARSILRTWADGYHAAAEIEIPTLVLHGRHDRVVPPVVVDRLRDVRPDWRYEVIDDCGHLPHVEHPDHFADLVAGWRDDRAPGARSRRSPGSLRSAQARRPHSP